MLFEWFLPIKKKKVANCLAKKDIGNVWWSNFPRDVIKIGFEDYCGSSFNRVCKISRP